MLAIEYIRRSKGLNQTQVGQLAKIGQPFISLIEQGRFIPSPDQIARLGRALGVPADALLEPVHLVLEDEEERELKQA